VLSGGRGYDKVIAHPISMQADGVIKRYVSACLTAVTKGIRAVVPAPGRSGKDLPGPDFWLKDGGAREGRALNWNIVGPG